MSKTQRFAYSGYITTGVPTTVVPTKIFDSIDRSNFGILYWNQKTLEQITKLSGPLAKNNEYQVHYWALVARFKFDDDSTMDVAFPTAIFNYKQEVSSAHIDFELSDVNVVSTAIEPVHNVVANKLIEQVRSAFVQYPNLHRNMEFLAVPLNTMHRHPTGTASFSGTDLRKNHQTDTGIVFPLKTADETPSFSSIIYNNPVKMVHTEYRIATGSVDSDTGIKYREGTCVTYVKGYMAMPSKAAQFFGVAPKDTSYVVTRAKDIDYSLILNVLNTIDYEPNTQFIKESNVSAKVFVTKPTSTTTTTTTKSTGTVVTTGKSTSELVMVYDKNMVKELKEVGKIDLKDFVEVEKMTIPELCLHNLKLERYYYCDDSLKLSEYDNLNKKDLIELAMELQDNIAAEYEACNVEDDDDNEGDILAYLFDENAHATKAEKIDMLIACGVQKNMLETASDVVIDRWYKELIHP